MNEARAPTAIVARARTASGEREPRGIAAADRGVTIADRDETIIVTIAVTTAVATTVATTARRR